MRVLAIETATPLASAAVVDEDGVLAESVLRAPMFHLEWLLPAVEAMLAHLAMTPGAIQGVAVSSGPGGFTGLRIGITSAAAWATMRRVPLLGVSTLEALARVAGVEGLVLPVLDAHRGEVAGALYRIASDGSAHCLVAPLVAAPDRLMAEVAVYPDQVLLLGDGLPRSAAAMRAFLGGRARAGAPHLHPRAAAVGLLALPRLVRGDRVDPAALRPIYGRRPVAWPRQETLGGRGNPQ
jgi:tRNA threonylcarbamoyladenosine biosynthesis protein TsaB